MKHARSFLKIMATLTLVVFHAQISSAQFIFQPIAGTASSEFGLQTLNRAYNGEGLSDSTIVENFDPIPVTWPTHASNPTSFGFWHSDIGDITPSITLELSGTFTINGVYLWNGNQPGSENDRGFRTVNIFASLDGISFTGAASGVSFAQGPGVDGYAGEFVSLSPFTARFVRMDVTDNWGSSVVTGISEIRFTGIPEPGVGALLIVACGLFLVARRGRGWKAPLA